MELVKSILGLLVCLTPILAIVVWLMVATRRAPCPHCKCGNEHNATTCAHCGRQLLPRQNT